MTAYRKSKLLASQSFIKHVGEENYKKLVNFILAYLSKIDLPIKRSVINKPALNLLTCNRGTFVEFRNGMINVSPIGRNAT